MKFNIITMFPEFFSGPLGVGIVGRAIESGLVEVNLVDLREYGVGKHRQLDDSPFGGGPGMVMMVEPLANALEPFEKTHRILFAPTGPPLTQDDLLRWSELEEVTIVCGRYEGIDQRVADQLIDEEVSLGDFVIAGGEAAAVVGIEGVSRLVEGVVGNPESISLESFQDGLLEEPVYTRPAVFRGWPVPDVLLSGDHGRIEEWRRSQRRERTRLRRPDLIENGESLQT